MLFGLGLASLLSTGCLVAEAPEYGPPRQTTPVVNLHELDPTPFKILVIDPMVPTQTFTVPIRSEDAGEQIVAALFLDPEYDRINEWIFPPATSSAQRNLSFQWQPRGISKGCHLLTLLVTHEGNYDFSADFFREAGDVATVTWWMDVEPDSNAPNTLVGCPTPTDAPDDET